MVALFVLADIGKEFLANRNKYTNIGAVIAAATSPHQNIMPLLTANVRMRRARLLRVELDVNVMCF